jgi:hypothetical protein
LIRVLDVVFSLDSVIVMMVASGSIRSFVEMLNLKIRARGPGPVKLRRTIEIPE